MQKRSSLRNALSILTLIVFSFSVQAEWHDDVKANIVKAIKRSGIPQNELGIIVSFHDGVSDVPIYSQNHDKLFIPASLSKIITGAATLKQFPVGYKFKTHLLSEAKVSNGVLKGDLYLRGGGDPSFISESMWFLVNEFKRSGIEKVEGNIVVDDSLFDTVRFDKDREDSRVDRAYDAPVGAMSFNWNSVNVYIRPGDRVGRPARVFADPESGYIKVINKATTASGRSKRIRVSRIKDKNHFGDTVIVTGSIGIKRDEVVSYKSITQPDFWSGYQLVEFLSQRGIEVGGNVVLGKTPSSAKVMSEAKSYNVGQVVADMMKYSNNYVAEMLTKNLVVHHSGTQGNMSGGLELIRDYLNTEVGLDAKKYNFINPSGLTRENKFRPEDILKLLNNVKSDYSIYPEFVHSLPIAGVDGTLKDRMKGTEAEVWVRAKTGMLSGVLGLAGYATRKNQETMTFVFLFNGEHRRMDRAIRLIDKLAAELIK